MATGPRAAWAADGAASASLQPVLLEVTVNGRREAEPVLLLRGEGGAIFASAALLKKWRLRTPAAEPLVQDGERYHRIDAGQGLSLTFSEAAQSLEINAQADRFESQRADLGDADALPMTRSGFGGFFNYDLFAEYAQGGGNLNGAFELGGFTPAGVGVSSFVGALGGERGKLTRLESSWTIDRPSRMSSIRIGDAISAAPSGMAPIRYGGIQFGRNFAVQPGFVTMPLPSLGGSATLPSVVDLFVDNALAGSRSVEPGPFEIDRVPVPTGGGTVQIVVRDILGRTTVSQQNYYASAALLRRRLHDFSYDVGFVRRGFGVRSFDYGSAVASTVHRYGLSDRLTVEANAQASRRIQAGGAGFLFSVPNLGLIGGSVAASRSARGSGLQAAATFEQRGNSFSLGGRAAFSSAGYAFIGMGEDRPLPRLEVQAYADRSFGTTVLGANLLHRDYRASARFAEFDRRRETIANLSASFRIDGARSLQLFARHTMAGRSETTLGGHLAWSFGPGRSASASTEWRGRGGSTSSFSVQNDPAGGFGGSLRASARMGDAAGAQTEYRWRGESAVLGAEVARSSGATGLRLSAAGAIGAVGGKVFASRSLQGSFAAIRVGQPGVRVYADNQLIGTTDRTGTVIAPALRAYDRNVIRIEEADLPLDVQVAENERSLRPFARAGAVIDFGLKRERGLLLQLVLDGGRQIPAGALARLGGGAERYVIVDDGEVYLPAPGTAIELDVRWDGGACTATIPAIEGDDPQPRLAGLVCRTGLLHAAR